MVIVFAYEQASIIDVPLQPRDSISQDVMGSLNVERLLDFCVRGEQEVE